VPEPVPDDVAALRERLRSGAPTLPGVHRSAPARVRWATTRRTLAVGAAALAVLTGGLVARGVAGAPSEAVPMPARMATSATAPSTSDASEPPESVAEAVEGDPAEVLVHVVGAVEEAGVVRLEAGSRVLDAVEGAGGATKDADLARLNLARVVADGEQVLVLRTGEEAPSGVELPAGPSEDPRTTAAGATLDLNAASASELEALPGIGPVLAQRIVEHRDAFGPFASVDALLEVSGVGPAVLEKLRSEVRV
jgi:competence protein ComEA